MTKFSQKIIVFAMHSTLPYTPESSTVCIWEKCKLKTTCSDRWSAWETSSTLRQSTMTACCEFSCASTFALLQSAKHSPENKLSYSLGSSLRRLHDHAVWLPPIMHDIALLRSSFSTSWSPWWRIDTTAHDSGPSTFNSHSSTTSWIYGLGVRQLYIS